MFSLYLGNIRKNTSHITFGGYDYTYLRTLPGYAKLSDAAIDNKITWVPLEAGAKKWDVPLTGVEANEKDKADNVVDLIKGESDCKAHLDTGASYSEVPP